MLARHLIGQRAVSGDPMLVMLVVLISIPRIFDASNARGPVSLDLPTASVQTHPITTHLYYFDSVR